ncbi:UDP-N-acetyl-D-mannosamine dehydrogenase [Pontibacillus chungwhensis BH030062]|uniref:UDP-N-acetyl-D-mannosamine dehydrogenase n=1 Tax=Pontibacillus chungwhensis BH030062 TaxID=1385513 RepID=A0A0A2UWY6_9BACI|nr:nucleotide sugar dehydrogenase [Pontibacillus chungwhensis]KGP92419.1 UDP-N-acetyl-D-mannosamine dehydrogenase [Pontibacillus chungwhensis BH030062]
MTKICVIGLGYIGLPTSAVFAKAGYDVVGIDVNKKVVDTLNEGKIHIEEPGLPEVVKEAVESGKLTASTEVQKADVFIIAVPTPVHEDKTANTDYVAKATESILPVLEKGNTIIVESTIPPRTIDDVVAPVLRDAGWNLEENDLYVSHCPERVIPGKIMEELIHNTRVVGGLTPEGAKKAADVYRLVVQGDIHETTAVTAEMSKLMENTFRDVNIALANELAKVSDKLDVNAHEVINFANMHPRVNILQPGPGVGGHCIAVDPYFIIEKAQEETPLMQTSRQINDSMPSFVVEKIETLTENVQNPKIAVFGLSYKANVDDVRESPAVTITRSLQSHKKGFNVAAHDPFVKQDMTDIPLHSVEEALQDADVALVLADHRQFKEMDPSLFAQFMKTPVVLDTRNCVPDHQDMTLYQIGHLTGLKPID